MWKNYPNSSFSNLNSLSQTWKARFFVFNFCLLMSFLIIHVFEKWWLIMCFFFLQELFGRCTFNYTHCISFAQLHCAFFEHIAFLFIFNSCKFLG